MPMNNVACATESAPISAPPQKRPSKRIERAGLTPKVRRAVELMVWDGKPCDEAAIEVGLTTRAIRLALEKPPVLAFFKSQLQVLRSSEQPRNIHRLRTIRDAAENMPAVNSALALMREESEQSMRQSGLTHVPHITIQILNAPGADRNILAQNVATQRNQQVTDGDD